MKRPPPQLAERLRAVSDDLLGPDRAPSVDEVAARSGIPRTTLYYYFSGREALLDFLLLDKVEQVGAAVREAAGRGEDPLDSLQLVLAAAVDTVAAHPTLCTLLLARLALVAQDEPDPLSVAVDRAVLRPLRGVLDAGVASGAFELEDADVVAQGLYGAVTMAALSRLARGGTVDADHLVETLVPRLVAAVRSPAATSGR